MVVLIFLLFFSLSFSQCKKTDNLGKLLNCLARGEWFGRISVSQKKLVKKTSTPSYNVFSLPKIEWKASEVESKPLILIRPPSVSASCTSISFDLGTMAVANWNTLKQTMISASNALVGGFLMGLIYSLPGVAEVMDRINKYAYYVNTLTQRACSIGKRLGSSFSDILREEFTKSNTESALGSGKSSVANVQNPKSCSPAIIPFDYLSSIYGSSKSPKRVSDLTLADLFTSITGAFIIKNDCSSVFIEGDPSLIDKIFSQNSSQATAISCASGDCKRVPVIVDIDLVSLVKNRIIQIINRVKNNSQTQKDLAYLEGLGIDPIVINYIVYLEKNKEWIKSEFFKNILAQRYAIESLKNLTISLISETQKACIDYFMTTKEQAEGSKEFCLKKMRNNLQSIFKMLDERSKTLKDEIQIMKEIRDQVLSLRNSLLNALR